MDQINVLSMAQAVTEKQPNPSAAGNSQTQSSSFREMLADRQKAVDDSGEKTSPAEKLEEQSSGKSTVNQTNSDMERMLWAAFMLMPAPPEKQMPMRRIRRFRGAPPCRFWRRPRHPVLRAGCKSRRPRRRMPRQSWRCFNRVSSRFCVRKLRNSLWREQTPAPSRNSSGIQTWRSNRPTSLSRNRHTVRKLRFSKRSPTSQSKWVRLK